MNLFGHDLLVLMASHGYLLLFVILVLEEAGLPLPIPGDLLLLFAGSMVAQGILGFAPALAAVTLATLIGTSLLYTIGLRGGRPLLHRYGRWLRLKPERIDRAERWLGRRPVSGVALLRMTPGLRIYSTMVAGLLAVPRRRATISFVLSGGLWGGAWLGLGMILGTKVNRAADLIARIDGLFVPLALMAAAGVVTVWVGRKIYRRVVRVGFPAGFRSRRPRMASAAIRTLALSILLVMPPLLGTLQSGDAHATQLIPIQRTTAQVFGNTTLSAE